MSLGAAQRTSGAVPQLFDTNLRALRRDRAARTGAELFLHERAFEDCLARIALMERRFDSALLIGCPDSGWRDRLHHLAEKVEVREPGPAWASAAGAETIVEDACVLEEGVYDLLLAVGTLDTVNDLPLALRLMRHALRGDGLVIGAFSGGETLPRLRRAMRAADAAAAVAAPHVHPRIEPAALAPLLADAGFINPVVDVDRVAVSYRSLANLLRDLRAMGATNVMTSRPPFLGKAAYAAAIKDFAAGGNAERTVETFEILHFAAWTQEKG